jgi:hypothetical protein
LKKVGKNGKTVEDNLKAVERQTKRRPKELDGPDFPSLLSHVWSAFLVLNSSRHYSEYGPQPIALRDIADYKDLYQVRLSPREVDIIKRLDRTYLEVSANE